MRKQTITTTMRITEVITEVADPIGVNKEAAGDLIKDHNHGEGANKVTTGDSIKVTVGNITTPVGTITITIIMVIIEVEMDMAVAAIISL